MSSSEEAEFDGSSSEEEAWDAADSKEEDSEDEEFQDETPTMKATQKREESDDEDFDSDEPLSALTSPPKPKVTKKKTEKKATKKKTEKKKPAKKKPEKKTVKKAKATPAKTAKASSKKESTTAAPDSYNSASAALYGTECKKGLLIQRLLCRWWYAMDWPDPTSLPESPPHYDALDGFPGVYVCTSGDRVGHIMDMRDASKCPNFQNFAKMTSEELKTLLLKALEQQRQALIAAEGLGTPTEKELDKMTKWAEKLNPASADKEAARVLKAAKLTLP